VTHTEILAYIFIISTMIPVTSYILFPLLLAIGAMFVKTKKPVKSDYPLVTLLISCHNEKEVIKKKLINSLDIVYPKGKLQILVIDDASNDGSKDIVKKFGDQGIELYESKKRGGKNVALNDCWSEIKGEIVVFSDANSMYDAHAVRKLVEAFWDPTVGCACGELQYTSKSSSSASSGEGLYWKYEQFLKITESRLGQLLVSNGAIFSIRKELFQELHPQVANDFQIPSNVSAQGYKIIYVKEAIATENITSNMNEEYQRKARIVARGFQGFREFYKEWNSLRFILFVQLKLARWLMAPIQLSIYITNTLLLENQIFQLLFVMQTTFYLLAILGYRFPNLKPGFLTIPTYFCLVNFAAMVGFYRFIRGTQKAFWTSPNSTR